MGDTHLYRKKTWERWWREREEKGKGGAALQAGFPAWLQRHAHQLQGADTTIKAEHLLQ